MTDEPKFPYTVKKEYMRLDDNLCCHTIPEGPWHTARCNKSVKQIIDGIGLCGIHARSVLNWRKP
jgi:hypothetical protein